MSVRTWSRDDVRQAVRESTAASGVPERITDPVLLDRLAVLLRPAVEAASSDVDAPTRHAASDGATSGAGSSQRSNWRTPDPAPAPLRKKNARRPSMSGDRSTGVRQHER